MCHFVNKILIDIYTLMVNTVNVIKRHIRAASRENPSSGFQTKRVSNPSP